MRLCRYDWLSTVEAVARRAEQERALHEIIERYSPPPMLETYLPYILGMPENTCHAYCTYHAYCINHAYCIYHAYCIHLYIPSIHTRHACTYFPYVMDVPESTLLPHLLESCLECLSVTAGLSKFFSSPAKILAWKSWTLAPILDWSSHTYSKKLSFDLRCPEFLRSL